MCFQQFNGVETDFFDNFFVGVGFCFETENEFDNAIGCKRGELVQTALDFAADVSVGVTVAGDFDFAERVAVILAVKNQLFGGNGVMS